ncbi:hypothetical protein PGT21_006769 [Puccinia graminis f. sp. tritici]|uniref:Uncharacterized protein n=1 Tax=Puccinia graminis f. sp. tritici TaxID=56615 RepID=A0A5B0MDN5_PUCGR|nr:hypothetical protein PGTUg99_028471 [Puccinia graminis f. sp. tritici]KAA1090606.1 hypothetical protein PGT21_006769 [Puccinia graminis f. sp. tritici]
MRLKIPTKITSRRTFYGKAQLENSFIPSYQLIKPEQEQQQQQQEQQHQNRSENQSISRLIQELKAQQPERRIELEKIENYSNINDQENDETQLAQLIRLSVKYSLSQSQKDLLEERPIEEYQDQTLIHGALLPIRDESLQYIINQVKLNNRLHHWIEQDLIQTLAQLNQTDLLFELLAKLSSRQYFSREKGTIALVERLLSHIPLPSDAPIQSIDSLAERIHQATSLEIFRDQSTQLAGKLLSRLKQPSFEHVWEWYQLSKSRTGGRVLEGCLVAILEFRAELARRPERLDQVIADFRGLALITRSLSSADLLRCIENLLWLAIGAQRGPLAGLALDGELTKPLEGKQMMEESTMVELLGRLLALAENREEAFMFYERLSRLGRPTPRFFERLLRDYLALCECPRTVEERAQALPMSRLMAILEHMKQASIPVDGQTYAVLLNHYSSVVRMNPRNLSTRLQLERIHTLIKLDINLEPDGQLIHQLFKAFSYNGLYDKAWTIWDRFFFPSSHVRKTKLGRQTEGFRRISNASFATMFDLAGFESERYGDGRLNLRALDGWAFLVHQALHPPHPNSNPETIEQPSACYLNKNLFDAWIECLCRARRIEDALMLIFPSSSISLTSSFASNNSNNDSPDDQLLDQPEDQEKLQSIIKPFIDQRTLSILLRFSKREDHLLLSSSSSASLLLPIVVQNIHAYFPQLWCLVKDQGRFN